MDKINRIQMNLPAESGRGILKIIVDGTGEYFGDGRNNDQNHLAGIQYYGLTAAMFINGYVRLDRLDGFDRPDEIR
jgi:hypothetical protein